MDRLKLAIALELVMMGLAVLLFLSLAGCDGIQNEVEAHGVPIMNITMPF